MRLMCAERDQLWAEYDAALRAYTAAVRQFAGGHRSPEAAAAVAHTHASVDEARIMLRRHCEECGCDPDWIRLLEQR